MEHWWASFTDQTPQQFTSQHFSAAAKTTIFLKEQIIYVNRYTGITFYEIKRPNWALTEYSQISAEHTRSNSAELRPASNVYTFYELCDWQNKSQTNSLG